MKNFSLPAFSRLNLFVGLLLLLMAWQAEAQVSLTSSDLTYTQDFNSLANAGSANALTLPGWLSNRASLLVGTGSGNTGGLYSFGAAAATERALGSVASGSANPVRYGVVLANNTGSAITSLRVSYTGEQWRTANAAVQSLSFGYATGTALTLEATVTNNEALSFTSPVSVSTASALDGNLAANRLTISGTIVFDTPVAAGQQILLTWTDTDNQGSDHGLALDDLSVTATIQGGGTPNPLLVVNPPSLSGLTGSAGTASGPRSYTLSGANLSADVVITAPAGFEISTGSSYGTSLSVPVSNSAVAATPINVRLTGAALGSFTGVITNVSGLASAEVSVSGTVFDPNTIASIALARSQPAGTPISSLPGGKIAGRVTVSNQFNDVSYIQDPTGGIAVFSTAFRNGVQIGDSVQITDGTLGVFSNNKQVSGTVQFTNFGPQGPLTPNVVTTSQLPDFEGQLVTINAAFIRPNTPVAAPNPVFVLTPDANFVLQDAAGTQELRINRATNIPGYTNPASAAAITGVVGRFNTITQLLPRFAQDIPGAVPYAPAGGNIDRSQTLDVAAWNIEWLGSTGNGPTNEAQQVANATAVLNGLQSDIIVLEEISSEEALPGLLVQMPGYQGSCSRFVSNNPGHEIPADPATPGTTLPANTQRVCVLYKSDVATLISQKPLLERAENLAGYPTDADNFWASGRYPYLWKFNVTVAGVSRQVNVIGIHAKANEGAPNSQVAYNRRKYDVQVLYDTLKAQYPNDLLILAGDLNDDLDRTVANVSTTETTYKPFMDDTASFTGVTKVLSDNGFRTYLTEDNVIDHILVSNELAPAYIGGTAAVGTPYTTISDYGNNTSDHVPVMARFDLSRLTSLRIQYQNGDNGQATNNQIKPYLKLVNDGTTAVPYPELTIRYWFTAENYAGINTFVDYAQLGNNKVKLFYVRQDAPARNGANGYVEYRFDPSAGNLAAGGNSGPIQARFANKDWSNLSENDDHSFGTSATYAPTDRITLYRNGVLVWGVEPQAVPAQTRVKVLSENKNFRPATNSISTYLNLINEGNVPLAYGELSVRYWFTKDGNASLNYWVDYAKLGNSNVMGQFAPVDPARAGADTYFEVKVKPSAGTLYPLSSTGNIQYRIAKANWSVFNEADDYSYKAAAPFAENDHITVYYQGNLIYGTEPGVSGARVSAEDNAGGLTVKVLSNPIGDVLRVEFTAIAGEEVRFQLTDVHGRTVSQNLVRATGQRQHQTMNLPHQAAGLYVLRASAGPQSRLIKLIK